MSKCLHYLLPRKTKTSLRGHQSIASFNEFWILREMHELRNLKKIFIPFCVNNLLIVTYVWLTHDKRSSIEFDDLLATPKKAVVHSGQSLFPAYSWVLAKRTAVRLVSRVVCLSVCPRYQCGRGPPGPSVCAVRARPACRRGAPAPSV